MVSCIDKKDVDKIYSTYQFPKADEYKAYSVYGGENIFSTRYHKLYKNLHYINNLLEIEAFTH
jgi:hypothetical protein